MLIWTVLLAAAAPAGAAESSPNLVVKPLETWCTVFGGQKLDFGFGVSAREAFKGAAGWAVSIDGRVVARGESELAAEPGKPGIVRPDFRVPPVKEGVAIQAVLAVTVYKAGAKSPQATAEKTIWVFCDDPFTDRARWLADLKIRLFDPEKTTKGVLDRAKVPYTAVNNVEALGDLKDGVLVIGEGVSFKDHRALPEVLVKAAGGGARVLCLAPSAGEMSLPGADGAPAPRPEGVSLRRNDIITELDKRLDASAWPRDGRVVRSSFAIKGDRSGVLAEVAAGDRAWPWLDLRFASAGARGGRLIFCGFAIVEKWDAGPTPRFLFARLLEMLDPTAGASTPPAQQGGGR